MKRYVKEFATATKQTTTGMNEKCKQKVLERIDRALMLNEKGYITDFKAVELILTATKEV